MNWYEKYSFTPDIDPYVEIGDSVSRRLHRPPELLFVPLVVEKDSVCQAKERFVVFVQFVLPFQFTIDR